MNKFDAKALGLKKPIELNVTNKVVEEVTKANLAIAKSYDMVDKADEEIMKEVLEANRAQENLLKNVVGLSDKEIKRINDEVNSFDLEMWIKEFTTAVFTVRSYGMTPLEVNEMETKEKSKSHHEDK